MLAQMPVAQTLTFPTTSIRGGRLPSSIPPTVVNENGIYPYLTSVKGDLPSGKTLKTDIPVVIDYADGEYIVSEQQYFNHAARGNLNDAITAFLRNLSDAYESLLEEESNLGDYLKEELGYLRSIISE